VAAQSVKHQRKHGETACAYGAQASRWCLNAVSWTVVCSGISGQSCHIRV
jgi:hypothetical protein